MFVYVLNVRAKWVLCHVPFCLKATMIQVHTCLPSLCLHFVPATEQDQYVPTVSRYSQQTVPNISKGLRVTSVSMTTSPIALSQSDNLASSTFSTHSEASSTAGECAMWSERSSTAREDPGNVYITRSYLKEFTTYSSLILLANFLWSYNVFAINIFTKHDYWKRSLFLRFLGRRLGCHYLCNPCTFASAQSLLFLTDLSGNWGSSRGCSSPSNALFAYKFYSSLHPFSVLLT